MIASGLTYPDRSDPREACRIVEKYGLKLPEPVENVLMRDAAAKKAGEGLQSGRGQVENHVVGSVRELCRAAAGHAEELGYHPYILTDSMQGEAREEGRRLASLADSPEY